MPKLTRREIAEVESMDAAALMARNSYVFGAYIALPMERTTAARQVIRAAKSAACAMGPKRRSAADALVDAIAMLESASPSQVGRRTALVRIGGKRGVTLLVTRTTDAPTVASALYAKATSCNPVVLAESTSIFA